MKDLSKILSHLMLIVGVVLFVACFGGFLLYVLWPHVVPAILPGLVAAGYVAKTINLSTAICVYWFFAIVLAGSKTSFKLKP